jgi:CDP-diacylglycerol--serine O-phosphatidyltransferase
MNIKKNIPNAITCGNLLCGCLAIVKCFEGDLVWAAYLVGIAAVLDFFDGFAARRLKVSSLIGKDLDSLADMVTFGVVPGIVMYKLLTNSIVLNNSNQVLEYIMNKPASLGELWSATNLSAKPDSYLPYIAFLIPIFSAIRLAKFNNDTRQSESFIGVPTPANAILICSFPLILEFNKLLFVLNPIFLCLVSCVMSLLLVTNLPLFALKFKNFTWTDNKIRFIFLGISLVLLAVFQIVGIPLVIILYILLSIVNNAFFNKQKNA